MWAHKPYPTPATNPAKTQAYNRRDLDTIQGLIADSIVYSDLVYEEPHEGREGVMEWLEKVGGTVADDVFDVLGFGAGEAG